MRIDIIVNTKARRNARDLGILPRTRSLAEGRARVYPTASLAELDATAREIAARGSDLVILSGGDGSFMAGVTALARAAGDARLPALAFLPGGTVATLARNWGMRGDPSELLRRILALGRDIVTTPRATLRVTAATGDATEERTGFMFGTGLVARFFDLYERAGAGGHAAALRIAARVFVESLYGGAYARRVLDPLPCTIEVEGHRLAPSAWSLVCAAVVRDLGLHMRVNYRAGEDTSRVHLVASPLSARELGPRAPLVLAGTSIGGDGHFDDLVTDFAVSFPGGPGPYVLDGETLRADRVEVRAGPRIQVVVLDPDRPPRARPETDRLST
jgi:diacylglycerol kinase (ATP)